MAPTWSEAFVEPSLDWRFLRYEDLEALVELRTAMSFFDGSDPRDLEQMQAAYKMPHAHPESHGVVGLDKAGTIVAYAWNHPSTPTETVPHIWMDTGVHPAWRHQDIGVKLIDWSIKRARMWFSHIKLENPQATSLWIGAAVEESSRNAENIVEQGQLHPQRWFFDMHRSLSQDLLGINVPNNFKVRRFDEDISELVRQAHNECFSRREGAHPVSETKWLQSINRDEFRANWSWVLIDSNCVDNKNQVVSYVLNCEFVDENGWREGWTERIGVRSEYEGRGLASYLLEVSMRTFKDAGCHEAGIGVDTDQPERALGWLTTLGYEADQRVILYGARFDD